MPLTLREYREDDFDAVCAIHDGARLDELDGSVDLRAFAPMAKEAKDEEFFESRTLVACDGPRVVGFIAWRQAYITWLYIDRAYYRRGVASRLLTEALKQIGPEAWLNTLAGNNSAVALYRKFGFDIVKQFSSDAGGFPCQTLRLALPTSPMHDPNLTREQYESRDR